MKSNEVWRKENQMSLWVLAVAVVLVIFEVGVQVGMSYERTRQSREKVESSARP